MASRQCSICTLKSLVTATAGTAGTAGTSGTSGIVRTLNHSMFFWPNEGTTSDSQRQYGYMLYKNPQLETGNKRTQFTRNSNPRKSANSLKDISGNKNSLSVVSNFDDSSLPIYSKGKFSNLGLPYCYFILSLSYYGLYVIDNQAYQYLKHQINCYLNA